MLFFVHRSFRNPPRPSRPPTLCREVPRSWVAKMEAERRPPWTRINGKPPEYCGRRHYLIRRKGRCAQATGGDPRGQAGHGPRGHAGNAFPLYYPAVEFDRPYTGTLIFTVADDTTEAAKGLQWARPGSRMLAPIGRPPPNYPCPRQCHQGARLDHRGSQTPRNRPLQRLALGPSRMEAI